MTVRSFQDHVQSLIGRRVAESKVDGANSPDIEARAVLESVALNLLLKPRAVLYLANLSRNSLRSAVASEIAAIDALKKTIDDLSNITFTASDTQPLEKAKTALLQMENLQKVDVNGGDFQRFSRSIDEFLNKTLAKNVKKRGATELSRSDVEAAADLPTDFALLVELHTSTIQKLRSLAVGIENFTNSSLGTVLGLSTAYRARTDLEDILSIYENGDAAQQSRDIAVRLIGSRAALRSIGTLPPMTESLISSTAKLPAGYVLKGRSVPTQAIATSSVGPFVFTAGASATVTVGTPIVAAAFPQSGLDLANRPIVVAQAVTFPVTIPGTSFLFVNVTRASAAGGYDLQPDGSYLKQFKIAFTAGPRTLSQTLSDLNTALGSDATAVEYVASGSGRIAIIGNAASTSVSISPMFTQVGPPYVFTESAHSYLGFSIGQRSLSGSTPISVVVDAFNILFGTVLTASQTSDQRVLLTTVEDAPGTQLTVSSDVSMGLNGTVVASSPTFELYGTVYGVSTDPVDPNPLLDVGDLVVVPGGSSSVASMTSTSVTLSSAIPTFDGNITATSALVTAVMSLDVAVQGYMPTWFSSDFGANLVLIDRAVAALAGKVTAGTRNFANTLLTNLRSLLSNLDTVLQTGTVPSNVGTEERLIVDGIISTLEERKYDRALSLLLELNLPDFLEMTGETASFGGNVLKTMSDLANTDIQFPNTEADEDSGFKGLIKEPTA